jgi:hypothetical protein
MARSPQTLAEAHQYIGSAVRKWFSDPPETAGWYEGVVTAVTEDEPADEGQAGRDIWYYVE